MASGGYGQNPRKETIYSGPSVPTVNTYGGVAARPVKETIYGESGGAGARTRGGKTINHDEIQKSGNVFFVIAAISVVNAILMAGGANRVLGIGLGVTRFLFTQAIITPSNTTPIFVISGVIVVVFVVLGIFARGGNDFAFLLGTVLYGADAVLLWLDGVPNHLPSLFMHAIFLVPMVKGLFQTYRWSR